MSAGRLAVPPGRAGRLWLRRRLAVAGRAAGLLERKLRVLAAELERRQATARRTGDEWGRLSREAQEALLRAVLLGGQRAVRLSAGGAFAEVTVSYTVTMGASHPDTATCSVPDDVAWEGAAVGEARHAHAAALAAGVAHAAALAALRVTESETAVTRQRLRAVRDRWIPRLRTALAAVEFSLEEQERADGARLRQALRRRAGY